jgi:dipeptide/tripeptide permease
MFSKHPKGLVAAALANMGERFGFYIMMAILTLFISAKFGLSETTTGYIYSAFYASIYILALVGGIIADKTKNFKGTIEFERPNLVAILPTGDFSSVGTVMILIAGVACLAVAFTSKKKMA